MGKIMEKKFIVRADLYGIIASNEKQKFWLPKVRGLLYFDDHFLHFKGKQEHDEFKLDFLKIIKVKMVSLNPVKNHWISGFLGSPYFLLVWNPFWNRWVLNITYLDETGQPMEVFFKLKTKGFTVTTLRLLKGYLEANK
ncbi:hypothetical protein [Thermincola ferriacetica]